MGYAHPLWDGIVLLYYIKLKYNKLILCTKRVLKIENVGGDFMDDDYYYYLNKKEIFRNEECKKHNSFVCIINATTEKKIGGKLLCKKSNSTKRKQFL